MTKFLRRGVLAAGLAAPFLARHGFAQSDWPKGPVRWVVAFAAGGGNAAVKACRQLQGQEGPPGQDARQKPRLQFLRFGLP